MRDLKDKIDQIINTFYKSTGIGILCFDTKLNITAYHPSKNLVNDFICLGISSIASFLAEEYTASEIKKNIFYTFFLESNLVCNVIFLDDGISYIGALVTQPVLVNKLNSYEVEKLLDNLNLSSENRSTVKNILLRAPVVPYDRIMPVGCMLNSLLNILVTEETPRQVLMGGSGVKSEVEFNILKSIKGRDPNKDALTRHSTYSNYLIIKENIQKGSTEELLSFINEINPGSVPMDQLQDSNFIRSLKNSLIKVCAMGCYAAIEANAPYYKTLDLADEFICQMEDLENINDIYELMKSSMISFSRAVSASQKRPYSKPIRRVIEFIEFNYAEKITLDMLAKHTNLSASYLSNIIKKETGLNLTDNINKIRVEESKKLLLNTNLSILEVALRVGFSYQNHFASIFKKFTGFAPTDFRKTVHLNKKSKTENNFEDEFLPVIFQQFKDNLGIYDIVRIVDPIKHISWIVSGDDENIVPGTCYDFWGRNESCKDCISTMAYLKNDTFFKIDYQNKNAFLVLAIPKTVGKNTYVVELLKNISSNACIDADNFKLLNVCRDVSFSRDEITGLYSRQYIDENLPVYFRRCKLEKKSFSIILSIIYSYDMINNKYDYSICHKVLREYARIILRSLENHEDWSGLYTGNVFLTVLNNADFDNASSIAKKIEDKFMNALVQFEKNDVRISVKYSVKTCSDDVHDVESLIKLASMDLHDSMNYSGNKYASKN